MFKTIATQDRLSEFTSTATPLVDEAKLHVGEAGVQIRAVDPANVGMVDVSLGAAAFESFDGGDTVLGLNLNRFDDILGMGDADDLFNVEYLTDERKLLVQTGGLEYTMALIDPDSVRKEPDMPELDLPVTARLEADRLSRSVRAADMVAEHIEFSADPDEEALVVRAEGDTDSVHDRIEGDDILEGSRFDGDALSIFSLDYIKDLRKGLPSDVEVDLSIGEAFPLALEWTFSEGDGEGKYMLAPRIEDN